MGLAAAKAFAAREAAFQESKEQRLGALRKEKERLELQEATFQPVIGAEGRRASGAGGGGANGGSSKGSAGAVGGVPSSSSQTKAPQPRVALERKGSVGFKVSPARQRFEHGGILCAVCWWIVDEDGDRRSGVVFLLTIAELVCTRRARYRLGFC